MRKLTILPLLVILLISLVSADIIINGEPKELYNLGDVISIPVKIIATEDITGSFKVHLLCNELETEVFKSDIKLITGEEITLNPIVIIDKERAGKETGICSIKASLGNEYILTSEFSISSSINIELINRQDEATPGETIVIEGQAEKENGELVKGFVDISIIVENDTIVESYDTVTNGYFYLEAPIPNGIKAGSYLMTIDVYEKEIEEEKTNHGFVNYNILMRQVPTSLEISFENPNVEPGTNLKVMAILHDQTGEKISSNSIITIKDAEGMILEQFEKPTDEFLEYPIIYNTPAAEWGVIILSNELTTESSFNIIEKTDVKVELLNKTIVISNAGNIPYDGSVEIKIGKASTKINVSLEVDESQKYVLTAPDGEYDIEIFSGGESKISGRAMLTGKVIDVKEASTGVISLIRYPLVWIFIIAILGFMTFMVVKKGYKRSFIGYIHKRKSKTKEPVVKSKSSLIDTKDKAELSLSIQGDKQNISITCLKIKNIKEIKSKKGSVEETLKNIENITKENKAVVYENQDNLFFLFIPSKTKTFKNEKLSIEFAQKIKKILDNHNKVFKQRIDYGLSINYGTIVSKQEKDSMKFMSMGTLITGAKKVASISHGEILLNEKIKERVISDVKTKKHTKGNVTVYTIEEMKNTEDHKKFIRSFLDRIEGK